MQMKRNSNASVRRLLQFCITGLLFLGVASGSYAAKYNLVFILADDLGWSDTTLYGTTKLYETPNIDRLARRGMRFTQAYAANPLCSPTRASILTGQYPARIGITAPACHLPQVVLEKKLTKATPNMRVIGADSVTRLKPDYYTMAEAFKDAGYATAHFGKWHLGQNGPYEPKDQGFDLDYPHAPAAPGPGGGYLAPWKFIANPNIKGRLGEHIEDRMSREAVAFMEKHKGETFFLNYWMFSVHAPFNAKKKLIEKYRQRINSSDLQRSPTYAAMVESMDDAVGTLLDALDRLGIADRTIVVFFSDNGGNMYDQVDGTTPTSNAPLRSGKASIYEGGTREPCVVVWPGKVKPGASSEAFFSSVDFYPTLLEMCGLRPQPGLRLDGVSQVPALLDKGAPRETVFCHFPHGSAAQAKEIDGFLPATSVRRGEWKLIRFYVGNSDGSDRFELYNLRDDVGETKNLAGAKPELVRELNTLITGFLADTAAVVPRLNPAYKAADGSKPAPTTKPAGAKAAKNAGS